jgi:hypothetical protein
MRWNQDAEARARQRHSLHRLGLRTKRLDCVPNSAMDFGTDTVRSGNVTRARPRRGRLMDGGWEAGNKPWEYVLRNRGRWE